MARIYVASSWRNVYYPEVVRRQREYVHEVYDFRNPPQGGRGTTASLWPERRARREESCSGAGMSGVSVSGGFLHDVETFWGLGLDFALLDLEYFCFSILRLRSSSEMSLGEIRYAHVPNLVVREFCDLYSSRWQSLTRWRLHMPCPCC